MVRARTKRMMASAKRTGSRCRTEARGAPIGERRRMFGGVRTARRTRAAPPSRRSCAISAPEEPGPTTRTSRSRQIAGDRYSAAWISGRRTLRDPATPG